MQTIDGKRSWILSTLSGFMLILIFPRFGFETLAWFALIPLFFVIQNSSPARTALMGFWTGMVFYFFGLNWVTNVIVNYGNLPVVLSYLILTLLAAYLSLYPALFCYLIKKSSRGNPLSIVFLAPGLWTSLEYLRSSHSKYGFSWLGLGYSQSKNLPVIQMAEITGVYGVSTLIVFVNACLFYLMTAWLARKEPTQGGKQAFTALGLLLAVVIAWIGYGQAALKKWENNSSDGKLIKVALIQGNIEQHLKWNPLYQNQVMKIYRDLSLEAAQSGPDLIVWPEAAIPFFYSLDKKNSPFIDDIARTTGTPLLLGSPYQEERKEKTVFFNSAYLIDAGGKTLGRYDKIHLVPFGEFVPFKKILWFVGKMVETIGDFGRGTEARVFDLNGFKLAISICYEITFPDLVRRPVNQGAQFLVNITNDAWFGKSAASYQHMDMAALRAVENRIPIVRAANTGVSGTIDPTGGVRQTTELFVTAAVITNIRPNPSERSFYSKNGDAFSRACLLLTAVFVLWLGFAKISEPLNRPPADQ